MAQYKYLIIGGGMTADAAVQGIRELDPEGSLGVISAEPDPPYNRPPLTKGLWKDQALDSIWRTQAKEKATLHLGRRATDLNLWRRQVTDDQGDTYTFEKLLLATGGVPRRLPFGGEDILYYRTVQDYRRLRALTEKIDKIAVIGAGFIGAELAAALALNKKQVSMLFPGRYISQRMFPSDLARFITDYYRKKGGEVLPQERPANMERAGDVFRLATESGRIIEAQAVVAGVGIEPNVALAQQSGLRVENGIVVDEYLATSHPDIFAAGDVAAFYSPALERRLRVEHEDNANTMGAWAGRNMAGISKAYSHLPFFYSDLFDLGYEAVGEIDSRHATVADWKQPFREGVVYYHRDEQIRGVLLWNTWGHVEAARQLIAEHRRFRPEDLRSERLLKAA